MKIIKNCRVYDLNYGKYETVTRLPEGLRRNAVGNLTVGVSRELRRDVASGEFYILDYTGGYTRENFAVTPVARDQAARIAEDFLDYDEYVKFFGDPEGTDAGLVRERDSAVDAKKEAERSKDFWYGEYDKAKKRVAELEARIAKLEARADEPEVCVAKPEAK